MIIYLSDLQKEHLNLIHNFDTEGLTNFCRLVIEYLNNGCNPSSVATQKFDLNETAVENAVHALLYLLVQGCQHNLSESDFKTSLAIAGFPEDHQKILQKFYNFKKAIISNTLHLLQQKDPAYQDFTWRFEIQVASRSCENEVKPIVAMDFITKTPKHSIENGVDNSNSVSVNCIIQEAKTASQCQNAITHNIVQCDLPNLLNLTDKLEQAIRESRSPHVRQVQRTFQ